MKQMWRGIKRKAIHDNYAGDILENQSSSSSTASVSGLLPPQMGKSNSAREDSDVTPVPEKVGD